MKLRQANSQTALKASVAPFEGPLSRCNNDRKSMLPITMLTKSVNDTKTFPLGIVFVTSVARSRHRDRRVSTRNSISAKTSKKTTDRARSRVCSCDSVRKSGGCRRRIAKQRAHTITDTNRLTKRRYKWSIAAREESKNARRLSCHGPSVSPRVLIKPIWNCRYYRRRGTEHLGHNIARIAFYEGRLAHKERQLANSFLTR